MQIVDYAIADNLFSTRTFEAIRQRPLLLFKTHWSSQHHITLISSEGFPFFNGSESALPSSTLLRLGYHKTVQAQRKFEPESPLGQEIA